MDDDGGLRQVLSGWAANGAALTTDWVSSTKSIVILVKQDPPRP